MAGMSCLDKMLDTAQNAFIVLKTSLMWKVRFHRESEVSIIFSEIEARIFKCTVTAQTTPLTQNSIEEQLYTARQHSFATVPLSLQTGNSRNRRESVVFS